MGRCNNTVKVDLEYICKELKKRGVTDTAFGKSLGYDVSWFGYVKRSGRIKKNVITLICNLYHMDEDKIILKEPEPMPEPTPAPAIEDNTLRALMCTMVRIEQKLNILLEKM